MVYSSGQKGLGSLHFLLVRDVRKELLRHLVFTQLLVHADQQPLGRGIHVTHLHPSLVVEEDVVALAGGVDAHVKLLLLRRAERRRHTVQSFSKGSGEFLDCCAQQHPLSFLSVGALCSLMPRPSGALAEAEKTFFSMLDKQFQFPV